MRLIAHCLSEAMAATVGGKAGVLPTQPPPAAAYENVAAVSLWELLYGADAQEEAKGDALDGVEDALAALGAAPTPAEKPHVKAQRRRDRRGHEMLGGIVAAVVPTVCSFAVSDAAPKAIFVAGQGSVLLRSVDRCRTWRSIELTPSPSAPEAHVECTDEPDDDARLDEILNIMNPDEALAMTKQPEGAKPDIYQVKVAQSRGLVVVCGQDGLLAAAADGGRKFTTFSRSRLDAFEFQGRRCFLNKHRTSNRLVGIHFVDFLTLSEKSHLHDGPHDGAVVFATSSGVFVAGYVIKGLGTVEFTFMYAVASGLEVGCVRQVGESLWISCKDSLQRYSVGNDGRLGRTQVVPHKGGTLRSLTTLSPAVWGKLNDVARQSIEHSLQACIDRARSPPTEKDGKYSYFTCVPAFGGQSTYHEFRNSATVEIDGVPITVFHCMGCGTDIVDYDFSALLAVGYMDGPGEPLLLTALINTAYTSLVKSIGEKVSTAVVCRPSNNSTVLLRSNRSGVSTSVDGGASWSTPSHAFTGELEATPYPTDAPLCIACGAKQCVVLSISAFVGGKNEVISLNASLRTKLLFSVGACW